MDLEPRLAWNGCCRQARNQGWRDLLHYITLNEQ
jgi:hypothetical protein